MQNPKKSLSQNFLIDKNISRKIVNIVKLKNKNVLEIGPGYGFMTDFILEKKPEKLYLVEKDIQLINHLKKKYQKNNKVEIIPYDILKHDFQSYNNLVVVSNLPYNVSTKIILYLFKYNLNINTMILMIQREVAIKFDYNIPGMNRYKFLTKIISTFKRNFDVSPNVFIPKPKIYSTVVSFKFNNNKVDLDKAISFSNTLFKNMRKKIYKKLNINNNNNILLNKRVNELSIDELLYIYNSFKFRF